MYQLGKTVRALRQRDRRTQSELAAALGITTQAVSRWEIGATNPDLELLPRIANYFHITIDELFGVESDRVLSLREIIERADEMLSTQKHLGVCIGYLRDAVREFPSEDRLLVRLVDALYQVGWRNHGAEYCVDADGVHIVENTEYTSKNKFWQEAIEVFEQMDTSALSPEDRFRAMTHAASLYALTGRQEKAYELAMKMDTAKISREYLLATSLRGEAQEKAQGEAVLTLLSMLKETVITSFLYKIDMTASDYPVRVMSALAGFYEALFDGGFAGYAHAEINELYLQCAAFAARAGETDRAKEYFDLAMKHAEKYDSLQGTGERGYSAPMFAKLSYDTDDWPLFSVLGHWTGWYCDIAPKEFLGGLTVPEFAEYPNVSKERFPWAKGK